MIKAIIFDFNGVIYTDDYDPKPLDLMSELRGMYKIGMITNYSQAGYEQYVTPVENYFDDIVVSSQVGLAKPHREIYELAAIRLKVQSSECVYIDDDDYRVEGAVRAGMAGIIYRNFDQMKVELNKLLASNPNN